MRSFLPLGEDVRFVVPSRRDRNWWREHAGRAYFGDLLFWICGGRQGHGTLLDFAVLIASAIVVVPLAVKTFRWEAAKN